MANVTAIPASPAALPSAWLSTPHAGPGLAFLALVSLITVGAVKSAPFFYRSWRLRRLPVPKGTHWLVGNFSDMLKANHHLFLRQATKDLGGIFRIRIFWLQMVVITDAHYVQAVLGNKENLNKGMEPDNSDRLLSVHGHRTLFSSDTNSKYWRMVRKGTSGAFQHKNIRQGFPDVRKTALRLVNNLAKLGPDTDMDMNNLTMRYTMDITGLVGFSKDFATCHSFDDAQTDELFDILRSSMLEAYRAAVNPVRRYLLFLPEVKAADRLFKAFRAHMRELVHEVRARGPPSADDPTVAAHLLRVRDPDTGEELSDDLLTGEFGVYFTASIESAGNAVSWTLFLLSQRPEVEAKIAAELAAAGLLASPENPNPRKMEYADLTKLPYFLTVCKESMRFRPVAATGTTRITQRDMDLGGYNVPAGSLVVAPFDSVHHNPQNWENPEQFKPERWNEPGPEFIPGTKVGDDTGVKRFMPFSIGPRACIGQSLAYMQHDFGVAILLSHFSFRLAPKMGGVQGVYDTEVNRLTLQPGSGLWMNAIPRAGANVTAQAL